MHNPDIFACAWNERWKCCGLITSCFRASAAFDEEEVWTISWFDCCLWEWGIWEASHYRRPAGILGCDVYSGTSYYTFLTLHLFKVWKIVCHFFWLKLYFVPGWGHSQKVWRDRNIEEEWLGTSTFRGKELGKIHSCVSNYKHFQLCRRQLINKCFFFSANLWGTWTRPHQMLYHPSESQ